MKEENFKWHLEAFASELFIYVCIHTYIFYVMSCYFMLCYVMLCYVSRFLLLI